MKTQKTQHSPTPWKFHDGGFDQRYFHGPDKMTAVLFLAAGASDADRDFTLRAVNSHDALVAACEAALHDLTETVKECGPCDHAVNICFCGYKRTVEDLTRALGLAQKGKV